MRWQSGRDPAGRGQPRRSASILALTWRRFLRSPGGLLGLMLVTLLIATAVFAPWIAPYPPLQMDRGAIYAPPSGRHLLGADELGRDMLSRLILGARVSITVASTAVPGQVGSGKDRGKRGRVIEVLPKTSKFR